jgi:hypothetical protein
LNLERLTVGAMLQRSLTVATAFGFEVRAATKALQVPQRPVAHDHDIASAATIAAVGAAPWHMGLASEAEAAITAPAGLYVNSSPILHA